MKVEKIAISATSESQAYLTTYVLDNSHEIDPTRQRPAIIICPGGGYEMTSDREAEAVAIKMLSYGFHAFVLRYSVAPAAFPTALLELASSVSLVRKNYQQWHVDPEKIVVAGFSAGGHLAASLGVFWQEEFIVKALGGENKDWQPNGLLLSYPVITSGEFAHQGSFDTLIGKAARISREELSLEKQISQATPPTFLWHTVADEAVPVENSLLFVQGLRKYQIPFELHLFPQGGHGLGLATTETGKHGIQQACAQWPDLFALWVKENI